MALLSAVTPKPRIPTMLMFFNPRYRSECRHTQTAHPIMLMFSIPDTQQRANTENSKQIFAEKKMGGHSPNFHIYMSVSDLYIPTIDRPVLQQEIQGASGIDARFLKLSPASAFSPIMTKFSQYTPYFTCYLVLVSICWQH